MRLVRLCLLLAVCTPVWGFNLIPNSSFEYWLFRYPIGWLTSNAFAESSVVRDTFAHTGDYSVKLEGSDTLAMVSTVAIIRPGFHYRFSGYCRIPSIMPSSFLLQFSSIRAGNVGQPIIIPTLYTGRSFREFERWITAPESSRFLTVMFITLPHADAYLDDVRLDDTTFLGVEEPEEVAVTPAGPRTRKLIVPMGASVSLDPGTEVYDLTGRRVSPCLKPGVYFILDKNYPVAR